MLHSAMWVSGPVFSMKYHYSSRMEVSLMHHWGLQFARELTLTQWWEQEEGKLQFQVGVWRHIEL